MGEVKSAQSGYLAGTENDDLLVLSENGSIHGGGGNDIIMDGDGENSLSGGSGSDVFVLGSDGSHDVISDFQVGIDRLDLTSMPGLYSFSRLAVTFNYSGARITYGNETLDILSNGVALSLEALKSAMVEDIHRPPLIVETDPQDPVSHDEAIDGTSGNDVLSGGLGRDTISGYEGADTLLGGADNDVLLGGAGSDHLAGG
ncbi:calcium-binding protein [Shimia isoporae]|uniref:calcium-binding protein n=1 Tax=Shimia isoporae TaxID=647720 RepID=UPI0010494433|nr:M10 family metallopeptidase C-terminal domain-containing protein [Shimia isoporae]